MSGSFDTGAVWSGSYWVRTWGTWTDDAANNRTSFSVNAQMGASAGMWFTDHDVTGNLTVNGTARVTYSGRYYMAGAGSTNGLTGWSGTINHDSNNGRLNGTNDSFGVSVTFGMVNQSLSYSMPVITASTSGTATNYDRSPTKPTTLSATRSSDGSSITAFTFTGGVNNSGPTPTYERRYSVNSNMSGYSTFTGTPLAVTPNVAYYFQVYASNADGNKTSDIYGPVYGVPSAPTGLTATRSTTDDKKINLSWTAPTNTQNGITGYDVYVGGTFVESTTSTSLASVKSTSAGAELTTGTTYSYYVVAKNALGYNNSTTYSRSGTVTAVSPGPPSAPTFGANPPSKLGRNVTVTVAADSNGYGNTVSNYYVQYRSASTSGGTYSAWSTPVLMTTSGSNKTYTYNLLPAALWYQFRTYATNSIVNNSAGTATYYPNINLAYTANFSPSVNGTTTMFVSAGGRRYRGTGETNAGTFQPTEIAKRVSGIASITAATGNGTTVTYTATNTFSAGDIVTVTGLGIASGTSLNLVNVVVATATSSQFTVTNSTVGVSSGTGRAVSYKDLTIAKKYSGSAWVDLT